MDDNYNLNEYDQVFNLGWPDGPFNVVVIERRESDADEFPPYQTEVWRVDNLVYMWEGSPHFSEITSTLFDEYNGGQ